VGNKKYFQYDNKIFGLDESEVNQFKSDMPAAVEVFPTQDENGQTKYLQQHELPEQPQAEKKKASSNGGAYSTIPGMEKLLSQSQSEEQGSTQAAAPSTAPQSLKYYAFGSSNVDFSKPTANVRIPESSIPNTVGEKIDRKAALQKAQSLSEFEIIDDEQRQLLQGSDYLQSRTGKVAEYISKIKKGKPIDQKDWQYLKESAPGIVADMVNQVKQGDGSGVLQAVNDENPLPDVISFYKQKYSTNKSYAAAENSKSAILTAQQLGFDINRYDDNKYLSEFMSKINADKQSEIEQAKLKYKPEDAEQFIGGAFVGPKDAMLRSVEFANKTTEIGRKYADLSHTYATASTQLLALKNNNLTPEKLGEHYLSIADPDRYALYKIAGSSDKKVKGELNKIGYNFVRGTLDQSKIASIEKLEDSYNDNFPEQKKEEIYHRLGAEMYKMRESGNGIRPGDIKGYDKIADTQFSKEDREFYYKHVRPEEAAKFIGTNVPLTGFANKLAHGIMTTGIETGKTVLDYLKLRNTQDQAADALKGQEVKYQDVGEYQQGKDRINELKNKPKLSFDEINELKDLERFVGVRSGLSENLDNIGNVTGQVITMALGTKGIGAAGKLAIGGEGLLASASKLEMLEKGGAALLGYAQSYDAARRDYLQLKPTASEDELELYGNWIGFLNAASENIFQDKKVFEAFNKEARQLASRVFESISDKNISQLTRKELGGVYTALLKDASKFAANYGKNNLQEVAEEEIVQLGTSIADGIAAPDKFNLNKEWEKVKATAVDMAIGGSLVAVPGAIHSSRSSRLTTPLLNQLGFDTKLRTEVTNVINEQVRQNKISQEEANKKLAVVNTIANIHGTTIQQAQEIRPLRKEEIEKITALTLQERINNEKIKAGSEFADELKNQNKEISDMRNKIMRKEVVVNDDYSLTDVDEWNKQNQPKPEPTEAEKLAKANQAQLDADNELVNNINDRNAISNNANQGNSGSSTTDTGNESSSAPDNINPDNPNTSTENGQNGEGNQGESSQGEPAPTGEKPTTDNGQSDNEQSNVPTDNQGDNGSEINAIESKRDSEIQKINDSNMGAAAKKAAIKRVQDKYQKQLDSIEQSQPDAVVQTEGTNKKEPIFTFDKDGNVVEAEQNDNLQFQVRQNQGPVTQDEIQDAKDKYYQALNDYITDNSKDIELIDAFDTVANISRNEAEKLIPETPVDIRDTFKEIVAETPLNDIEEKVSETPQPEQPKEDTPEQTTTEHENMLDEMLNPGRLFHEGTEILQDAKITSENRGFNAAGGTREEFAFIETSNRIHDIMKKYSSILMGDFYNSIEKILSDQLMPLWLKAAVLTRLQQAISEGEPILSKPLVENLTSKYSFGTEGVATEISSAMQLLAFTKQLTKEQKQQLLEIFGKTGSLIQLTRDQLSELVGSGVIDEITGTQLAEMSNQIEQSGKRFEELEADRKKLRDELDKEKMKKKAKKKNAAMRTASPNLLLNIQSQIQKINEIKC